MEGSFKRKEEEEEEAQDIGKAGSEMRNFQFPAESALNREISEKKWAKIMVDYALTCYPTSHSIRVFKRTELLSSERNAASGAGSKQDFGAAA